ncbi:hypothetical protein K474DRAFT_1366548 [Panus rudis PR-1116 ss-1]|nr:hypothetical protein K474DRAFT_1366548 [Panus rudis PR-1116 ss-1]
MSCVRSLYHISIPTMSIPHPYDDTSSLHRQDFDLPLVHHPVPSMSYSSSLAADLDSYLPTFDKYIMDGSGSLPHYWATGQPTPFTDPFNQDAGSSYAAEQTNFRHPSPRTVYETPAPPNWGEPTMDERADGVAHQSSFHSNFQNTYAPRTTVYTHSAWSVPEQLAPAAPPASSSTPQPWSMSGSFDPSTGIYQHAPEHPRIRTAQACEKCRVRKAKCSGEKTGCERCRKRGLICEYGERRMRGPNKVKRRGVVEAASGITRRASTISSSSGSDSHPTRERSHSVSVAHLARSRAPPLNPSPLGSRPASRPELSMSNAASPCGSSSSDLDQDHRSPAPSMSSVSSQESYESPRFNRLKPPGHLQLPQSNLHAELQYPPHAQFQFPSNSFVASAEIDAQRERSPGIAARRSSLPAYLLEAYSNVAIGGAASGAQGQGEGQREFSGDLSDVTPRASEQLGPMLRHARSGSLLEQQSRLSNGFLSPHSLLSQQPNTHPHAHEQNHHHQSSHSRSSSTSTSFSFPSTPQFPGSVLSNPLSQSHLHSHSHGGHSNPNAHAHPSIIHEDLAYPDSDDLAGQYFSQLTDYAGFGSFQHEGNVSTNGAGEQDAWTNLGLDLDVDVDVDVTPGVGTRDKRSSAVGYVIA